VPVAWVAIGFNIDDAVVKDLGRLTGLDVSFASRNGDDDWRLQASTLALPSAITDARLRRESLRGRRRRRQRRIERRVVDARAAGVAATRIASSRCCSSRSIVALEPFRHLQRQLLFVSLVAVVVSISRAC
jgi:hypothetical protein